ncbi:hypothetical protein GCM10009125_24560 [Castellaniella daejeonensis]|jgi:CRISPR-associated endonuclease Csy4|uniref:CRISPR-associated nuclease/helicase Cas3 I-F/YPEST Cas2 domain-containing protein n=1 Tax=Castellaniella daejeonensis TaxID=659013 RepID=A0ABP3DK42_9BURK
MNVLLVSQCSKRALTETRRILDQFAERRGDRTWQTAITRAGLEEAVHAIPDSVEEQPDLPYVQLRSASTGQRFCLFLALGDPQPEAVSGVFNTYGLSSTATLPWF